MPEESADIRIIGFNEERSGPIRKTEEGVFFYKLSGSPDPLWLEIWRMKLQGRGRLGTLAYDLNLTGADLSFRCLRSEVEKAERQAGEIIEETNRRRHEERSKQERAQAKNAEEEERDQEAWNSLVSGIKSRFSGKG